MADQSLSATYTASRKTADDAELERWLAEKPPPPVLGPPTPQPGQGAEKPPEKPGALAAIGGTIKDTFTEGASHFIAGLGNRPKSAMDFEGAGQQVLGLMQMLAALPAGAGAAFKQALGKFAPGLEGDVAIKGGGAGETTTAGIVRSVLGAPIAMMLDPKMKAEIAKNPVPFAEALNADMTYGELADIVGQTIGIPLTMKAGRAVVGRAKGGPAAPGATPEAPPAAPTEPRAPLALSEHTEALVTPPPSASSAFETRIRAAQLEGPEAYARVVADELRMALEQADAPPKFADVLREKYRPAAPEEGPPRAAMEPAAPAAAAPEVPRAAPETPPISGGSLPATMERALASSEQVIAETLTTIGTRAKTRKAKPPKEPEAPAALPEEGAAPKAADPLAALSKDEIDSVMGSLDLMYTELKEAAPGARHLLTDDMGKVEGGLRQPSTYPDFISAVGLTKTRANADRLMKVIDEVQAGQTDGPLHRAVIDYAREHWDEWAGQFDLGAEGGAVSPALLARMALGAAAGGTQGDTPEDRIRNAFLGMGLSAVLSKSLAAKVAQSYKQSGLADESGALDFSKWRKKPAVQESEQPFQPNYARIEATPDVKAVMKNIHRMMKEDILEQRGPARTNDLRVKEALELISTEKMTPERVLTLGNKEMLNDSEYTAARILTVRASQHAAELRNQINAGQPVPEGSLKQSIAIAGAMGRNVLVARKRIAQTQQSGAIRVSGEGVSYRPEDVASLADEIAPGMTDRQVATMMNKMTPIDQVERFSTWMTLFPKMLLQSVYFSYLSGKATARNVVGNLSMMGLAPVERGIGRFMPLWGDPKPGIVPGEATQMARVLGESLWDQLRMVRHVDEIEAAAVKEGVNISSVKSDRRAPSGREFVEGVTDNQSLQRLGDWYDNVTTFPGKVLDQTDVASKTINARMQHSAEAMRQATFEGQTGEKFEARYTELMDDITQLSETSRQRITDFADRQTFTQDFEGKMLRSLSQGPDNEWLNLGYRSFIMPFFRVTARMTEATLARTPGLNFLAKQFWTDWNAGGAQRQVAQARVVGGAATIGAFMYLEAQGGLTGNAPKDATLRKLWQDAGYQERSWWDGSQWRSYDGLGPLTSLIAGAADTSMMARKLPEQTGATLTFAYVLSQINTLDSRTFMQSLSHIGDVIKTKNSDTQVEKAMEVLRRQVAGWMKPGVLRELETLTDPEIRRALRSGAYEEGSFQQEWNTLLDEVRAGMPGWSAARDAEGNFLIPPARHRITGEPIIVDSYPFNPMPGRTPKDIEVKKPDGTMTGVSAEILRLNGAGLDEWPEWMGPMAPKASYGLTTPNPRAGVRLTNQERDRYAVLFSQEIKNADGQTYAQALKATLEDPNYWAESDGMPLGTNSGKAAWLQRLDRDFAQMTKEALFMEGRSAEGQPGALERTLLEKQAEAGIQKTPTAQQPEVRGLVEDTLRTLRGLPSTLSR